MTQFSPKLSNFAPKTPPNPAIVPQNDPKSIFACCTSNDASWRMECRSDRYLTQFFPKLPNLPEHPPICPKMIPNQFSHVVPQTTRRGARNAAVSVAFSSKLPNFATKNSTKSPILAQNDPKSIFACSTSNDAFSRKECCSECRLTKFFTKLPILPPKLSKIFYVATK